MSNAVDGKDAKQLFRVTHPFHPLCGREFVLVELGKVWGEERVYFHDDHGSLRRLPASWTSICAEDPFVVVSAGRAFFRVADLLRLVELVTNVEGSDRSEKDGECKGKDVHEGKVKYVPKDGQGEQG